MPQGQPSPPSRQGAAGGRIGAGGHTPMHPAIHPPFVHRPFHWGNRPFVWVPPAWYGSVPDYAPAPVFVYNPPVIALAPPPPPVPSVVEYPTGRFEMRGDGITSPYQWVWVPNPPAAPPPAPPPPPAPRAPVAAEPSSSRPSQVYRWIDEDGVANWTNAWDSIPERYRAQARRRAAG
jgi:hypothetical protein